MKSLLIAGLLVVSTVGAAYAVDEHHPEKAKQTPAATNPAAKASAREQSGAFQEQMKKAQSQVDRVKNTNDPKERQQLMHEHMRTMQAAMGMMRGMRGNDSSGMHGGMMGGDMHQAMRGDEMMCMDMMQQMMHQMMQHMEAAQPK